MQIHKCNVIYKYIRKKECIYIVGGHNNFMKVDNTKSTKIGNYDVYERESIRGWSITITPIGIRIDDFHGYPHIHFSLKGKKHKINVEKFEEAIYIVFLHISKNKKINLKKLFEELL